MNPPSVTVTKTIQFVVSLVLKIGHDGFSKRTAFLTV